MIVEVTSVVCVTTPVDVPMTVVTGTVLVTCVVPVTTEFSVEVTVVVTGTSVVSVSVLVIVSVTVPAVLVTRVVSVVVSVARVVSVFVTVTATVLVTKVVSVSVVVVTTWAKLGSASVARATTQATIKRMLVILRVNAKLYSQVDKSTGFRLELPHLADVKPLCMNHP